MLLLGKGLLMSKVESAGTRDVFAHCSTGPPRGTTVQDPVRSAKWRRAALIAVAITAFLLPAHAASAATLELDGTIQTSPFIGSSTIE